MKAKITKIDGKIHRIETTTGETMFGQGLTEWEYILLNRIYRKFMKQSNK